MKKLTTFLITLVGILTLVLFCVTGKPVSADTLEVKAEFGVNSIDSDLYSISFQAEVGSVRLTDTKTGIIQKQHYGARAGFKDTYNVNDLQITANMSNFTAGNVLCLNIGYASDQPYYSEAGSEIVMDIYVGSDHQYLVTFNREGDHNVSIEGFDNGVPTIHGSYSGMTVTAADDLVTIKIKKTETTVELSVNEYTASVPTALDGMQAPTASYLGTTIFGGTEGDYYYELDVVDAERKAYYSETGAYGIQKALVEAYANAVSSGNLAAAKVAKEEIDLSGLKSYDVPRLQKEIDAIDELCAGVKPNPEINVYPSDVNWFSQWQPTLNGAIRLDDTTVRVIGQANNGVRGGFSNTFDLSTLDLVANMKESPTSQILTLTFDNGTGQKWYSENCGFSMDIVKKDVNEHVYIVTLTNTTSHNISVDGFTGGEEPFRGDFTGMGITANDDLIKISFRLVEENIEVKVNNITVSLGREAVFSKVTDLQNVYITSGLLTVDGCPNVIYELSASDQATRDYYSETGAYGVQKARMDAYTAALAEDLTVKENCLAAQAIQQQIDLSGLRSYDIPRLSSTKDTNDAVLEAALIALGEAEAKPKPVQGVVAEDSNYYSLWQSSNFGSVRLDDTTVGVVGVYGTGQRGGFTETYDLGSLQTSFNLKSIVGSQIFVVMFNNSESQLWYTEDGCGLGMDIYKKETTGHDYLITLFKGGSGASHNISIEGFEGGQPSWRGDYQGIVVTASDDIINISFAVEGENVVITINEVVVTMSKAAVFEKINNVESVYVATGIMGTSAEGAYECEISISDAATRTYYSPEGTYGKAKAALDAYSASLEADLTVEENVRAAMALRDAVVLVGIKAHDLPRLQPTKEANDAVLALAMENLHMNDKAPVAETVEVDYRLDKGTNIEVVVDLFESELKSVTIGEIVLEESKYEYVEGKLVVNASALVELTAGTYNLVITTNGGSCTVVVTVYTGEEFVPTIVEESVEHQLGTAADVVVHIDTKGNEITSVSVNGEETTEFTYNDGVFTLNNVYVEELEAGAYTVVVTTADGQVQFEMALNAAANPSDREPVMGEYGSDVNFYSRFQSSAFGAVRTGDTSMKVLMSSAFGYRGGFRNTFDVTNLEGSLDLSEFGTNAIVMVLLTTVEQKYFSESDNSVYLEIVKMTDTTFFVAFGNPSLSQHKHATSYPEFTDGTSSDKPGFTGITVTSETAEINFKMVLNEDKSVTVTVNGAQFNIPNAFSVLPDPKEVYISLAGMTDTMTIQKFTVNYLYDAALKEYYSETGAFGVAKAKLTELLEAIKSLKTAAEVYSAVELKDSIDVRSLYDYDYNYIKADYERACTILDKAIVENPAILIEVATKAVNTAVEAANAMIDLTTASLVQELIDEATARINGLKGNEEISEQTVAQLESTLAGAISTRESKIKEYVTNQFNEYVNSVGAISDVESMRTAIYLKGQISTQYESVFTEEEWNTLIANKAEADMKLAELVNYSGTDWTVENSNINILEKDGEFHIVNLGGLVAYNKEKLDITNLDVELTNVSVSKNIGSWLSIGIMEKPELFVNSEDEKAQENKGFVFLMTYSDPTHITVELYIITLMSAGFLASNIQETMVVDISNGLNFHIGTKEVTTAGVTANYIDVRFNDTEMQSLINPAQFQISLGQDKMGYLNISTSGGSSDSPFTYTIKSVNGHKLTDETLAKEYVPTPPTSTETSKEFTMGTTSAVAYPVNTYGLPVIKVVVGGAEIASSNYTYANNYLSFKNAFLSSLEKGTYKVSVETKDGKVELTLIVKEAPKEPTEPSNKGCSCSSGAIVAAIASVVTVAAASAVLLKKREY